MVHQKRIWVLGVVLISLFGILICVHRSVAIAGQTTSNFIIEYPLPGGERPLHIAVESPGYVWFTLPQDNAIGSLVVTSTLDYQFTLYDLPNPGSEPYDVVYDGQYVWLTERAGNRIGRFDPATTTFDEFTLPTANSAPTGIAAAPDGTIWFTEQNSNQIGHLTADLATYTPYSYTVANAQPDDIAVLNDDTIWFSAPGANRVVRLRPSTTTFSPVPLQLFPGGDTFPPGGLALDSNEPWVTAPTMQLVGRYAPGTLAFWNWYAPPLTDGGATAVVYRLAGGNSNLWFVEPSVNRVGWVVVNNLGGVVAFLQRPLPTPNSQPQDLALDSTNTLWITENAAGQIATWSPPYFLSTYLPLVQKP